MSIRPPTDIVLDVARAADPQAYKVAAARLDSLNATAAFAAGDAGQFASVFDEVDPAQAEGDAADSVETALAPLTQMPFDAAEAMTQLKNNAVLANAATDGAINSSAPASANAYRSFEAMVMSTFVESMLPKSSEALFGSGSAGEIWRSMFAQQIAMQLADAGGIGIADKLKAAAPKPAST